MSNPARDIIWPDNSKVLVRVVMLYVGQGDASIVLAADTNTYRVLLADINLDEERGGIDVPRLMKDLLHRNHLHAFVNTHPHNDHVRGVGKLSDTIDIDEVWHSGHKPGKKHDDAYQELQKVIKKVKKEGGREIQLKGGRQVKTIGEARYYVLAPAEYVTEEIEDESDDERYRRIHEQCAVLKFGSGNTWIMLTGDADRDAWEKHITNYHEERLPAVVLSAAHHGSRTFFRYDEREEPYKDALKKIDPDYVIMSAPKSDESPHNHPHEDAVEFYSEQVGEEDVLHTGEKRESFICDIYRDEGFSVDSDSGRLVDEYRLEKGNKNGGGSGGQSKKATGVAIGTRVDRRPMGKGDA